MNKAEMRGIELREHIRAWPRFVFFLSKMFSKRQMMGTQKAEVDLKQETKWTGLPPFIYYRLWFEKRASDKNSYAMTKQEER